MAKKPPSYRKQKRSNGCDLAFMELGGVRVYLGPYNSPESRTLYGRKLAEFEAAGRMLPVPQNEITVGELIARYWVHTDCYYSKNGKPTSEAGLVRNALGPLDTLYGALPAIEFGPLKLRTVRNSFIKSGLCRTTVNRNTQRIQAAFRWAVSHELIPGSVTNALDSVAGLRKGRSLARESKPVRPVPDEFVDAIKPFVSSQVWALIELQRLTGMRSGEVVIMRGRDLDMTGKVWLYRPESHKTMHHGHTRIVEIGKRGQAVIKPFLKTDLEAFLFSPADAVAEQQAEKRSRRKSKVQPSQRNRSKANPKIKPGDRYTTGSYRRAIARACELAFKKLPDDIEVGSEAAENWFRDHRWHPHQLRHNFGTMIRKQFGIEASRIMLGHSSVPMAELYSEIDRTKARAIIAKIG